LATHNAREISPVQTVRDPAKVAVAGDAERVFLGVEGDRNADR
jgi:hypothetical protein